MNGHQGYGYLVSIISSPFALSLNSCTLWAWLSRTSLLCLYFFIYFTLLFESISPAALALGPKETSESVA